MEEPKLVYPNLLEKEGLKIEMLGDKAKRKVAEINKVYNAKNFKSGLTDAAKQKIADLDEDICEIIAAYLVKKEAEEEQTPPPPPPPPPPPAPPAPPEQKSRIRIYGFHKSS